MKTHHVLVILVVDTRVLGYVADSLQERRFASISPTDYKDTKAFIFRSEIIVFTAAHVVVSGEPGEVKKTWRIAGKEVMWLLVAPTLVPQVLKKKNCAYGRHPDRPTATTTTTRGRSQDADASRVIGIYFLFYFIFTNLFANEYYMHHRWPSGTDHRQRQRHLMWHFIYWLWKIMTTTYFSFIYFFPPSSWRAFPRNPFFFFYYYY